ncbi:transposase [bacterium]|nr:transposase [bacterium]
MGKAFNYMLKHWEPLTRFHEIPGCPLDNNIVERYLKSAILHRKNRFIVYIRVPGEL